MQVPSYFCKVVTSSELCYAIPQSEAQLGPMPVTSSYIHIDTPLTDGKASIE